MFGEWLTSDSSVLLNLHVQVAPEELFHLLQRQSGQIVRNGIYSARLVIWLMMNQRLQGAGRWPGAWGPLVQGQFAPLLSRCKRVERS
jgi:hypothetical protein